MLNGDLKIKTKIKVVEKKLFCFSELAELPKPIFSHRSVTVKKSTYKHFYDLKEPIGG